MKRTQDGPKKMDSYVESVGDRQRNLTPPDLLRNGRSVDEALWKVGRHSPLVQRIGAVVLGLMYLMVAVALTSMVAGQNLWFGFVIGVLGFAIGIWLIWNAFLR